MLLPGPKCCHKISIKGTGMVRHRGAVVPIAEKSCFPETRSKLCFSISNKRSNKHFSMTRNDPTRLWCVTVGHRRPRTACQHPPSSEPTSSSVTRRWHRQEEEVNILTVFKGHWWDWSGATSKEVRLPVSTCKYPQMISRLCDRLLTFYKLRS